MASFVLIGDAAYRRSRSGVRAPRFRTAEMKAAFDHESPPGCILEFRRQIVDRFPETRTSFATRRSSRVLWCKTRAHSCRASAHEGYDKPSTGCPCVNSTKCPSRSHIIVKQPTLPPASVGRSTSIPNFLLFRQPHLPALSVHTETRGGPYVK